SAAWTDRLERLDAAIQTRDVYRAVSQWHEAYGEGVRSRDWRAFLDVGDRAVRIDDLVLRPESFLDEARRSYLTALLHARREGSAAGVLGAGDAFARLGDDAAASAARRMLPGPTSAS